LFSETKEGVRISLFVQPNAPKNEIVGEYNNQLKIKIHALPVDGKANQAIIEFFSESLAVPKRNLKILKGESSKTKALLVQGLSLSEIRIRLGI
jgi:uncharacterized protein (TIGR00251 family)